MAKLPELDCKYGAWMGRASRDINNAGPIKMHLQRVHLDSGGYDSGGAYWGLRLRGQSLYWYWWKGNKPKPESAPFVITGFIDATSRADAKEQIKVNYPEATFYR